MIRTSETHPLQIATVQAGEGLGRIGLSFCPGKYQPGAMSGSWARDLDTDLDAIAAWGAAAVVTLIEPKEMTALKVEGMGDAVNQHGMRWWHLPIPDVTSPGPAFERQWESAGPALRGLLRNGYSVFVHCKGGLGRAGTITARLLVELGWAPAQAIQAVRKARPGAIETRAQEEHVHVIKPVEDYAPLTATSSIEDRAIGCLLGLAVGDAVGTTLEFKSRDSYPPLTDMIGGGPFRLKPGEWTDDTAMALALADSLFDKPALDADDLARRFVSWWRGGTYSATGTCFDIGITTRAALAKYEGTGNPMAGSTDPYSAGNGSLMRLAPVAIWGVKNGLDRARIAAREQSAVTHGATACLDACEAYAVVLLSAINGATLSEALSAARELKLEEPIASIIGGSWQGKSRDQIKSSGYVAHSLEAALWCVVATDNFRDAVLLAANLGDDADTTGAIAGQLAGALYGKAGIPRHWLERLSWRPRIEGMARNLLED